MRTLARQAGISPTVTPVQPGAPLLEELAGPEAPFVEPAPAPAPQQQASAGSGRRRRGSASGSGGGSAKAGGSPKGSGSGAASSGRSSGPARTRAELAARAGSHSAASFSGRTRRGR